MIPMGRKDRLGRRQRQTPQGQLGPKLSTQSSMYLDAIALSKVEVSKGLAVAATATKHDLVILNEVKNLKHI
jgi:hypothetical protein